MRFRESFSLYRRRVPSGRVVFYYRSYDEDGRRICGHSTGQTTRTAAREYCNRLNREGKLKYEKQSRFVMPLFKEFAAGWWDFESCPYLKSRKGRRPISKAYAAQGQYSVKSHLLPAFGEKRIDRISEGDVDSWLTNFTSRAYTRKDGKTQIKYKTNTGNIAFKILKIMLNYAVRQKLIAVNPCKNVEMLIADDEKEIKILTPDEVRELFPARWEAVWDERLFYVLNKLAACTGMRHGELLGLRREFVHEGYIDVCAQYTCYGYGDVKTHKPRNIPIPSGLRRDLELLMRDNGEGYLFSRDGGKNPVSRGYVYKSLYEALDRIGIDEDARKARNLSMHGWRHFFNTTLLMANVSDSKVMSITGHTTENMKNRYTHFDNTKMADVIKVQEGLLLPGPKKKPVKRKEEKTAKRAAKKSDKKEAGEGKTLKRGCKKAS
jgi:integrase